MNICSFTASKPLTYSTFHQDKDSFSKSSNVAATSCANLLALGQSTSETLIGGLAKIVLKILEEHMVGLLPSPSIFSGLIHHVASPGQKISREKYEMYTNFSHF